MEYDRKLPVCVRIHVSLSIAVVQIAGEDAGGIFTFAFTTFGQHMFMMAYFGIRPFQITDTGGKYSFGDYLGLRLLTCGAAVLTGMGYVLLNGYSFEKAAVVFLMVVYKVIDALADAYEAEFQRGGRLYLTGKSNAFRTILSVGVFLASLAYTKDLAAASLWAVGAQAAGFLVFDVLVIRELPNVEWRSAKGKKQELFAETILLFCSAVLDFYIFSASKYAIEGCMADRDMAVFGAIFMPTSIINLVAGFVIRPYLTKMSFTWEMGTDQAVFKDPEADRSDHRGPDGAGCGRRVASGDPGVKPSVSQPADRPFPVPAGTGFDHFRRSPECVHEPVLLFAGDHEKAEIYFRGLRPGEPYGSPGLHALCAVGRDPRGSPGLCGPDRCLNGAVRPH